MIAKLCLDEPLGAPSAAKLTSAFGYPRDFLDNRFVYLTISPRARGLSIGVNLNPDKFCNFDCVYCEVNRDIPAPDRELDIGVMAAELEKTLFLIHSGEIRHHSPYCRLNGDLLRLRHVALSGDGEPTLCPEFPEAVEAVVHLRAQNAHPFFKVALLTNGATPDLQRVLEGLRYFTRDDEIWLKLDAGSQEYLDKVNRSGVSLEKIMQNALELGRLRPIVIQSLFPSIDGHGPPLEEIARYIGCLNDLKNGGAQIAMVQIYSATRPTIHAECGHLSLKDLSAICRQVRARTSLKAEVF